jgi:hypothetical protein
MVIVNVLSFHAWNGYPKSSRVSETLKIDFSSYRVSCCSCSGAALLRYAPLSQCRKVPYDIQSVEAVAQIDEDLNGMHVSLCKSHSFSPLLHLWASLCQLLSCCGETVKIGNVSHVIKHSCSSRLGAMLHDRLLGCGRLHTNVPDSLVLS